LYGRTWLKTLRRPVVLTFSFVQPLMWMLFFGFLFERYELFTVGDDLVYLDYLAPGVCAMTVMFGASQSGIGWIRDLQTGFLQRMLNTPQSHHAILGGKILADVSRLCLQALVVLGLAVLLGARVRTSALTVAGAFGVLALFAAGFSCLSCAIALKTRAQEAMAVFVHVVNMPLLFTSTALVPDKQMPGWLADVSRWNPLSLAVNAWRDALLFDRLPALGTVALLAGFGTVLYLVAARQMWRCADAA
jgi:ABC-2 type transport system permease protein